MKLIHFHCMVLTPSGKLEQGEAQVVFKWWQEPDGNEMHGLCCDGQANTVEEAIIKAVQALLKLYSDQSINIEQYHENMQYENNYNK